MTRVPAICLASLLLVGPGPDLFAQAVADSLVPSLDALLSTKISSAAKYQQTISEAASSVTIITAKDIRRHGYGTLPEALAAARGFYLSYDRNYSFLGARGFSRPSNNHRVSCAGGRQRDQRRGLHQLVREHGERHAGDPAPEERCHLGAEETPEGAVRQQARRVGDGQLAAPPVEARAGSSFSRSTAFPSWVASTRRSPKSQ
ncbi:MAG: hypothetical protein H0X69_13025 [Gemmatimonadales bacterium]|nr:hypothetical protein [Gemmatimonadales bacterium]